MGRARHALFTKLVGLALPRGRTVTGQDQPARDDARHLLVDVSVVCQEDARTGIQRVVRGVLLQLLAMRLDGYVVRPVYATAGGGYRYAFFDSSVADGLGLGADGTIVDARPGDLFLGLDLAAHILPTQRATIRAWKARGVRVAIVIYDLLPVLQPEWFSDRMVRHFRRWLAVIADHADSVLCISAHVARDFRQWVARHDAGRAHTIAVHQVPLGHDLAATSPSRGMPDNSAAIIAAIASAPTMLMVGTVEPRKGYDVSLAGFEHLWQQAPDSPYRLVIVGKRGWKTDDLQARMRHHPESGKRLFWFEEASDEFLDHLYRACSAVMVASHTEGFGLPVVEAKGYGKPVLVRDVPVFRELGSDNVVFFQDDAAVPLSGAIAAMLGDGRQAAAAAAQAYRPVVWKEAVKAWLAVLDIHEVRPDAAEHSDDAGIPVSGSMANH